MSDLKLFITGVAGRDLLFAVTRLRDNAYYYPASKCWRKPRGKAADAYTSLDAASGGCYSAGLPELDPQHDYCVYVFDKATQQLVLSQLVDGHGWTIHMPRAGTQTGPNPPRNEYHGGFKVDVRSGRNIELE